MNEVFRPDQPPCPECEKAGLSEGSRTRVDWVYIHDFDVNEIVIAYVCSQDHRWQVRKSTEPEEPKGEQQK